MEIERKFLLRAPPAEGGPAPIELLQGYLALGDELEVRVRIAGDSAFLAVKTLRASGSLSRHEYEYPIPLGHASELLRLCCGERIVRKRRRVVRHAGAAWEIDEYFGPNEGLLTAEIELSAESEPIELPPWIGAEVTHDSRYANRNLATRPFRTWSVADGGAEC